MELEQIRLLMTEIGPAMDLAGVAEYGGSDAPGWGLLMGDDLELWVALDADCPALLLSAVLGKPPAPDRKRERAALFETLMAYNGQRDVTGGVVIALNDPNGELVQSFALPTQGLELNRLMQVVANFAEVWRGWRDIIAADAPGQADAENANPRRPLPDGMKV